jgi:hypothetical protein
VWWAVLLRSSLQPWPWRILLHHRCVVHREFFVILLPFGARKISPPRHAQVYIGNEGFNIIRKLPRDDPPGESTKGPPACLRYFELSGLASSFNPFPPILGASLKAKQFYVFVVTDWSLLVLSKDSSSQALGSVLLEIPWLGIRSIVSGELICMEKDEWHDLPFIVQDFEDADSHTILNSKQGTFKSGIICVYPKVRELCHY